jgi:hypothetical protein
MFDDIWTVTIEKAVQPDNLRSVASYTPIEWRGKVMKDISMAECIQWAIEDFNEHKKNQEAMLDSMKVRDNKMKLCSHPGCIHLEGNCPDHPEPYCEEIVTVDHQFGVETVDAFRRLWYNTDKATNFIDSAYDRADKEAAKYIYKEGSKLLKSKEWIRIVPSQLMSHKRAPEVIKWFYQDELVHAYKSEFMFQMSCVIVPPLLIIGFTGWKFAWLVTIALFLRMLFRMRYTYARLEDDLFKELKEKNLDIEPIIKTYRDEYAAHICTACIGIAAVYGLARAYRAYRNNEHKSQGSLEPKTKEEVKERDTEANVWTSVTKRDLPISDISKRMSVDQLNNIVHKALVYGSIHDGQEQDGRVNGLMLSSNVMLIPTHYFTMCGDELKCTFRKKNPEASGGKFAAIINKKFSHQIPNTDLSVCYVTTGGSFKNLVNFFPTGDMPQVPFQMHWRQKDGEMIIAKGLTVPSVVQTVCRFNGGSYKNLTIDTFAGLCGATLVSETNGSTILGIHLGGTSGTPCGVYGSVTQQQLFTAFEDLRSMEGVLLTGEAGKFETTVLGVQVLTSNELHKKSAVNYMPKNSQVEYFGSCPGRAVMKSEVKVTPISAHIVDVCGVPNIYRGPKLNPDWYGWQTCLANLAVPATPYSPELLELAIRDYREPLLELFKSSLWNDACPLNDKQNLCGISGKKFMDAIKLNTSVGFPLTGPKREYVTELEPTDEFPNNRELDKVLMDEIKRIEDCYRRGERGYPIAKACKKDEILSKDKCRIFYGNALSLTYLIRKYYLPLLRVLQMNPLVSECAVGINSHGPEWDEFHKHAYKFGEDRLFGGDYGKYDQKIPSQLILAALRILIDLARVCKYTSDDLKIMEAMAGDIVFAYIAFNGDLIGLTEGTHISGNSLTVIINGICGSLNLRCFFYHVYPPTSFEDRMVFRENVAIMTYGDDNIGSVKKEVDKFTIKGCSLFLKEYGQIYTMPDKESELLDFLPPDEFEFLKRKSIYHPKLGVHVGALLDKSIYKSLHCFMRGKNCVDTEESACAQNIDGALREWFNHGEDKYEKQRELMKQVANRAGISHMCTGLNTTYNERIIEWREKYKKDP